MDVRTQIWVLPEDLCKKDPCNLSCTRLRVPPVALHVSRYTCRATRVAADFLDFIAFCRCSTGVALHPLKILVSHLSPPPFPGGVAPKFGSEKVSRYTGVSQLQLRVSRYTVQLNLQFQHRNVRVKSWQPMSNSWPTSSQPALVRALGRRRTARNRQGKILYRSLRHDNKISRLSIFHFQNFDCHDVSHEK